MMNKLAQYAIAMFLGTQLVDKCLAYSEDYVHADESNHTEQDFVESIDNEKIEDFKANVLKEQNLDDFTPFVVGNNTCYMSQGFYPVDELQKILPKKMSIPDEDTMKTYYDDVAIVDGMHPFMLSFCHGEQIHDLYTKINVPA